MNVFIASDHRGFEMKGKLISLLNSTNISLVDLGPHEFAAGDDYPVFALEVCKHISSQSESKGILICGSGTGMNIAANKIPGIRAGFAFNVDQVKASCLEDDINVLCVPSDHMDAEAAVACITTFLQNSFDNEPQHARRLLQIAEIEKHI